MRFAAYFTATGRIVNVFDAADEEHAQTAATDGIAVLEVGAEVTDATHYIDGSAVAFPVQGNPAQTWDWTAKAWVDQRSLDDVKAAKWTEIKAAREAIEYGSFTWDGSTFDADPVSTSRIMGAFALALAAQAAGQPYSQDWTLADNTTRTLSAADMLTVGAALGARVAGAFATASTLRAQIEAATTIEEVEDVTWA